MAANADILIRILGGVRAALEADTVSDAMDRLADQNDQAARAAVRLTAALKWMGRQLRRTARDGTLASIGVSLFSAAMSVAKLVALGLATLALPALAIALYNVAFAAGIVAVAFVGGMGAILGASVLMAVGVIDRFKQMSEVVGTAANDLRNAAYSVRGAFRDATAAGSDALMRGLARGLEMLAPLLRSLEGAFTAVGKAFGDAFERLFGRIATMGPQLNAMFRELVPTIRAGGDMLGTLLELLVQIGTVGAPLVADAFRWLDRQMRAWTGSFTDGKLEAAKQTLRDFADGIKAFFGAFAAPIKPFFGDAMKEFGESWKTLGPSIGTVLGHIVAGFMKLGRFALPYVTKGMAWLAARMPGIMAWLEKAGSAVFGAIKDAWPFFANVVWPILKGIAKSIGSLLGIAFKAIGWIAKALGWVGEKLEPLKGAFEVVGQIIGFVFGPQILGGIAKVIGKVSSLGSRGGVVFRFLGGVIGGAAKAISGLFSGLSKVASYVMGKFWGAFKWVWSKLTGFQKFVASIGAGIATALATAFKSTVNWIIDKLNWLIRAYNGTAGKIPGAPNIGEITPLGGKAPGQIAGSMIPPASTLFPKTTRPGGTPGGGKRPTRAAARSSEPRITRHQTVVQIGARQIAEAMSEWADNQTALEG